MIPRRSAASDLRLSAHVPLDFEYIKQYQYVEHILARLTGNSGQIR
jgi:hypothetical protein